MVELGECDRLIWVVSENDKYSSFDTWNALRDKQGYVDWWQLIWFPFIIPKYAFILWLAMKNALTTGDQLLRWGFYETQNVCFAGML
jgi:hypothetical protein